MPIPELFDSLRRHEAELTRICGDALPRLTADQVDAVRRRLDGWRASNHAHAGAFFGRLASAYRETGDETFAAAVREALTAVLDREAADGTWRPPEKYDPLMIPHRLGDTEAVGWFGALPVLLDSEAFDEAFVERVVLAARDQLDFLVDRRIDGRNIRMTEGDGLWTQGFRLSFLPESKRWREVGLATVNDCIARLFHDDGSSSEATGWYHHIVANMALRFWQLAQALDDVHVPTTAEHIGRMHEYTLAQVAPCGRLNRIGDCTAAVSPDGTLAAMLDRRNRIHVTLGLYAGEPATSQTYHGAGQALLRSDWSADATYITFDATERNGYHWHPSRNSVQLQIGEDRVLADPGRMGYAPTIGRSYALSTRGHSTCNLNGWNQIDTAMRLRSRATDGFDIVDALYDGGYWPGGALAGNYGSAPGAGIFGQHHRTLLWMRGRAVVVLDHLRHQEVEGNKPTLECNWQFSPGTIDVDAADGRVVTTHGSTRTLMLFPMLPDGSQFALHEGGTEPPLGWIANDEDAAEAAPLLRVFTPASDPWDAHYAAVIVPFTGDAAPDVAVTKAAPPRGAARAGTTEVGRGPATPGELSLRFGDGVTCDIHYTRRLAYSLESVDGTPTDASLVLVERDGRGNATRTLVCDATYFGDEPPRTDGQATWVMA